MTYQNNRFADRQQLNSELFSAWKSQIDADFGLYKSTRDGFDVLSAKQNQDAFNLYKSQRDSDDEIRKELSDLKAQVAINAAVRPYQDKLIQCGILTEMMENLMTTNPFSFKTSFIGDIEIGGGQIKFNLPLTNKRLVLNMSDLEAFKETLITKN